MRSIGHLAAQAYTHRRVIDDRGKENMVPLDSAIWGQVHHCYGPASDIPDQLRQLAKAPGPEESEDIWDWFWSALWHQGDTYQASYVAVPHIVAIASKAAWPIHWGFFNLAGSIEFARASGRGPAVELQYGGAYFTALQKLLDCMSQHVHDPWSKEITQSIVMAFAAIKGDHRLAEAIAFLDKDWIAEIIDYPEPGRR